MTTDDQRKAIAVAVGITNIKPCPYRHPKDTPEWVGESPKPFVGWMCYSSRGPRFSGRLPKYTEDLNAMHQAEATLTPEQQAGYEANLDAITRHFAYRATAEQRAEAFLKTLNLWQDEA